ncbi:hypothetical protein [Rhodococcus sp. ACT016]|uniref:hypothetical protein n=1 Tax=Rhodococcus sp. ACT016 TaxID=3134808 RepID=UPI003D2DDBE9
MAKQEIARRRNAADANVLFELGGTHSASYGCPPVTAKSTPAEAVYERSCVIVGGKWHGSEVPDWHALLS